MIDSLKGFITEENLNFIYTWMMTSGLRIFITALGAFILLRISYSLIGRVTNVMSKKDDEDLLGTEEREKRIVTITGLLRGAATVTITIVALMMILKEIGMDIAPIIAGAGILGLAIGFGAQNLVKDFISGFFILVENQVRVGDVAIINDTTGLVEEINLRTIVMRDLQGIVHIFPNGTIDTLANMSKGWSRYVIDVGVAYKENVDHVMKVLGEIGEEIYDDEEYGPLTLEPLQILGVDNFGSSEVVIKCMIKTMPLKQWEVGRELRRRIKNTFDEKGIEIPFPHMSIYAGEASKPFKIDAIETKDEKDERMSATG